MTLFDLKDKTILITGGNQGIGLALAKALHQYGANIAIAARNVEQNRHASNSICPQGERVMTIKCDVTQEEDVESAIDQITEWGGTLYGCIANAGRRGFGAPITECSLDHWRQTMNVNLDGAFITLKAASQRLTAQKQGGRLIAIASVSALKGNAQFSDYCASKAGLTGLCRSLASELAPDGITVNCIVPGWVETQMNQDVIEDRRQYEAIKRLRIPMQRWAKPEDLAGVAVYLMSSASGYHTGDALVIDGGYSIF